MWSKSGRECLAIFLMKLRELAFSEIFFFYKSISFYFIFLAGRGEVLFVKLILHNWIFFNVAKCLNNGVFLLI